MRQIGLLLLSATLLACEPAEPATTAGAESAGVGEENPQEEAALPEQGEEGMPGVEEPAEEPTEEPVEEPVVEEEPVEEPVVEPELPVGEGYAVGQIAENWTLRNQQGEEVDLHDYYGKVIFFEDGSQW